MRFESYCIRDREFFSESSPPADTGSAWPTWEMPGYVVENDGYWTHLLPKSSRRLEDQGWKIHLSSAFGSEQQVIRAAVKICGDLALPFKYVSAPGLYRLANSKNADRTTAGKLVTIYPPAVHLQQTLDRLEEELGDIAGPHILTDVRWRNGPIFVRYGAFIEMRNDGRYCIRNPEGSWEEDVRQPWFTCPEWVDIPPFLRPSVERRNLHAVPLSIHAAVKHSNAGGIYLAEWLETGLEILVKEGRRYTGYTSDGADGYNRISSEARVLRELNGVGAGPRLMWDGELSGHYFIAITRHPGITLQRWMASNMPIYDDSRQAWEEYATDCELIVAGLIAAVSELSEAGFVHGDLHPQNIMVDPETMTIGLVDFETAVPIGSGAARGINAPGYSVPEGMDPQYIDRFAVTTIVTDMLTGRVEHEDITAERYNWSLSALLDRLESRDGSIPPAVHRLISLRREMLRNMRQSENGAEPPTDFLARLREDLPAVAVTARQRIGHLPVHYEALEDELCGLGLGAAGHALAYVEDPHDVVVRDLVQEAERSRRAGLFDGLCGSVYALLSLGAEKEARALLSDGNLIGRAPGLRVFDGVAGILLAALKMESYPMIVKHITDDIENDIAIFAREYLTGSDWNPSVSAVRTNRFAAQSSGLVYGDLGMAWLFSAAYRRYGKILFLDAMNRALLAELRRYELDSRGGLQFKDNGRLLPYLATGSAGFGVVLHDLDTDVVDPVVVDAVDDLIVAGSPTMSTGCGLFNGYTGLFYGANGLRKFVGKPCRPLTDLETVVRGMAVPMSFGRWAVPGDENLRITTDLATGVSGIVHAVNMICQDFYGLIRPL
ncbi:phosphotransferase [Nocardia wallacei]|uniref:class III lanthionine synthetase LanKC N-terminal domain-containing protein n=1 Tax=Nocardia wallacei TaxID=480035 RepID=UPI00245664E2|nr:phosphotransferase [Nocardia wallacei]